MAEMVEQSEKNVVFGLDIGTRSVVGTVGYMEDEIFNVIEITGNGPLKASDIFLRQIILCY